MSDHAQDPTRHPNYPLVSYEEVFRDTGLDQRNVIFDSEDVARSTVGGWIEEEDADFKDRTGWALSTSELDNMTAYYIVKIKKCILMMVKMRVYERAIGVRPSERDHYVNLREEIRRRVEGLWGRGGMIRELWKPATDVTATKVTHTDDYLDERINEV
jgi:hypothetical protein